MKKSLVPLYFIALFLISLAWHTPLAAQPAADKGPYAKIRLVPERDHVNAGDIIFIAIEQDIAPSWHTYWVNPGDSGEPLRIKWKLPEGFETDEIKWPVPEKMAIGEFISYGYQDNAILLQPLVIPAVIPEGPLTLQAEVTVLVCEEICIPEISHHELVLNSPDEPVDNSAYIDEAYNNLPMDIPLRAGFGEENGEFVLNVEFLLTALVSDFGYDPQPVLIPYEWGIIDDAAITKGRIENNYLYLRQKRGTRSLAEFETISGVIAYTDSSGNREGLLFSAEPDSSLGEIIVTTDSTSKEGNIWQALLFALMGGIILNLMPCVFPVLSLKAIKLCRLSGKELGDARIDSLFYTAGILVSFTAFALFLIGLRAAGQQVGWGFQLQSSGFVLFLSWLLFVIGLNLSGFFDIGSSVTGTGSRFIKGQSHTASFMTGVLAAIVATPCVAPFMGVALGFALAKPAGIAIAVFLSLGLGLALPYIMLAAFPALRSALPAPGPWMETFRQFLAFPMYAAAIWLVWVLSKQGGSTHIIIALSGAFSLAFAIWVWKKASQTGVTAVLLKLLGFVFILITCALLYLAVQISGQSGSPDISETAINWQPYTEAGFTELEAGDAPIFVNMTAAWCITCKFNEQVAIETEKTQALFNNSGIQAVKGDWTNYNKEITTYLGQFGRNGVPLYVYYGPRDSETGLRPEPNMLPQILTAGIIKETIERSLK